MLDHPYSFRKASKETNTNRPGVLSLLIYVFQLEDVLKKKIIYIVEVEIYKYNIHAVKFYEKSMKGHKNKYNLLTRNHKANRIIATCLHIILDVIHREPNANIGFFASRTKNEDDKYTEDLRLNKRFRIYQQAFQDFFGPQTFSHYPDNNTSTYLLINNKNNVKEVKENAEKMFSSLYPHLYL